MTAKALTGWTEGPTGSDLAPPTVQILRAVAGSFNISDASHTLHAFSPLYSVLLVEDIYLATVPTTLDVVGGLTGASATRFLS